MAKKITDADIANKGVIGLDDVPGLTATQMQKKFEELETDVIIPKVNEIIDDVDALNGSLEKVKGMQNYVSNISANSSITVKFSDYTTALVSAGYGNEAIQYYAGLILAPKGGVVDLKSSGAITIAQDDAAWVITNNLSAALRVTITSFRGSFTIS